MDTLSRLIDALRCLPGVGPKSAQRMVFHLLQHQRQRGLHLAACLEEAMNRIGHCHRCNNYSELELCNFCTNPQRDSSQLCVVSNPADIAAIEQTHAYFGLYFVLMGKISPLDGLGPEEIGLPKLQALLHNEPIQEVILAFNPSIETQTTVHFIHQLIEKGRIHLSQLAHGIPSGGELEFLDSHTISSAFRHRASIDV